MFCKCQTEIGLIVVNIHNYFYVISFHFDTPTKFVLYFSSNMSNYMHWAKFMEIPISVASTSKVGKLFQLWSFFNIMKITWIFIEFLNDCKNIWIKKTITFPYFSFHIEFERQREKKTYFFPSLLWDVLLIKYYVVTYRTPAIITRGLYFFNLLFENHLCIFKDVCFKNSTHRYVRLYSRAGHIGARTVIVMSLF